MIFRYENTPEDYLDALVLQKANARQNRTLFHLILLLVIGCLVYLNMSTLRLSFDRNDSVAYWAALVVMGILVVNYSPKIIPSLILRGRYALNRLPPELMEDREFEMTETFLCFRHGKTEVRVCYEGLSRVNHNNTTVLFYLQSGVVEAVPLRVLGDCASERTEILKEIEASAVKANSRKKPSRLPAWFPETGNQLVCSIQAEDVFRCTRFHQRIQRRLRLRKDPIQWLSLALILLCGIGGVYGLTHLARLPEDFCPYLRIFYLLELPGCAAAALLWYRPAALANYGIRQAIRLGRYPYGYLGERNVEWNETSLAFRYGVYGVRVDLEGISRICDDGSYLYFYENDILTLFLPKAGITPEFLCFVQCQKSTSKLIN